MSGGGSGGSSAPANTTSQVTNTVVQDVPAWEQQYLTGLLGQAQSVAAQPYQQFPGQQVAGFSPDQTQAFTNIENQIGSGQAADTGVAATNSATAGANTANGIAAAGSPYLQASALYNPAAAAAPYTNAAVNAATPQGISSYLSPYTQNVVGGLVNTANQNWNQNIMPGVNDSFIGSGQYGSGRNAQVLGQTANQFQTNLDTSVANALQTGYGMAGSQAATQAGILGQAANTAGSTAGAEASNLQNIGTGLGNLAATQSGAQGAAATNLANTANTVQNTGITGDSALQAVGQQQQNLAQTNINTAMTNFQNQALWPQQQTSFLSDIIRGLPTPTSSASSGQSPTTTNMVSGTSPLSSLAGSLITAGAGVGGVAGGKKRGGLIKKYADGGSVSGVAAMPDDSNDDAGMSFLSSLLARNSNGGSVAPQAPTAQPDPSAGIPIDANAPVMQAAVDESALRIPASPLQTQDVGTAPVDKLPSASPLAVPAPQGSEESVRTDQDIANKTGSAEPANANPLAYSAKDASSMRGDSAPPTDSPLAYAGKGYDPAEMRRYQLLMLAKGLMSPARSGAEALANGVGNYAQTGIDNQKMLAEQQQKMLPLQLEQQRMLQENSHWKDQLAQQADLKHESMQLRADTAQQNIDLRRQIAGLDNPTSTLPAGKNAFGYDVGSIPLGSSAPVLDPKFNVYANATPSQLAQTQRAQDKQLDADVAASTANQNAIVQLNAAKDDVKKAYTGGIFNLPGVSSVYDAFSSPRQEINSLNKELALSPGERPQGMRLTQGEVYMLRQAVPGNDKSQEANINIADAAIAVRERPVEWAKFKTDFMANNGYWNDSIGNQMFNKYIKDNPIFDPKAIDDKTSAQAKSFALNPNRQSLEDYMNSGGFSNYGVKGNPQAVSKQQPTATTGAGGGSAATSGSIPTFSSQSDPAFKSLPSGTQFRTQDGQIRIKH